LVTFQGGITKTTTINAVIRCVLAFCMLNEFVSVALVVWRIVAFFKGGDLIFYALKHSAALLAPLALVLLE
jgi:hypothetical protein